MAKKNELLENDIKQRIEDVRYEKPEENKSRQSIFYLFVVFLVTISVLLSLFRYLF